MPQHALDTLLADVTARLAHASGSIAERAGILRSLDAADEALQREYEAYPRGEGSEPGADPRVAAYHDAQGYLRCARDPPEKPRSLGPHVVPAARGAYEAELRRLASVVDRLVVR